LRKLWATVVGGRGTVREKSRHRTILDLGTEQVKALVLEIQSDEDLVVGVGRARHQHRWGLDGASDDVEAIVRSCDLALRQAEDMTSEVCGRQVVPDWVVVGLPNSATIGEALAVTHRRPNAAKQVSAKELKGVVERAQRLALQQLGGKVESLRGSEDMKVELLESAITDMRVGGHSVTNPIGFRGDTLTVGVFNVVASSEDLRAIGSIAEKLGLEIVTIISGWQALASALADEEGICIDVGGMATDIALVQNGNARAIASLPLGGNDFTKHLARTYALSWADAESLKLGYATGTIEGDSESHVPEAMGQMMEGWLAAVEANLKRLSGSQPLPHQFSLCGGGSSLPGLVELMRSHPWSRTLRFQRHPQVRLMQPVEIACVLDRAGQLGGPQDVAPLALAGYAMGLSPQRDALQRLLRQVKRPAVLCGLEGKA
jgi:cell division protein FtsA